MEKKKRQPTPETEVEKMDRPLCVRVDAATIQRIEKLKAHHGSTSKAVRAAIEAAEAQLESPDADAKEALRKVILELERIRRSV